jgi:structural maintenance of chromosome 3 (chondroitin sulfate proteoglycan 6)
VLRSLLVYHAHSISQVFGRTIICADLPTAAQYTRSHGLNAVTVDGDRADRRGALTGGYHDVRKSRLDTVKAVKRWRDEFEKDSSRHAEVKEALVRLEQAISKSMGEIQVLEAKRKQIVDGRSYASVSTARFGKDEEESRARVGRLETGLVDGEGELRGVGEKRTGLEEEIKTPMVQKLSNDEVKSLETLTKDQDGQKKALVDATKARQKVR